MTEEFTSFFWSAVMGGHLFAIGLEWLWAFFKRVTR